jgi:hypothetical protein
MTDLQIASIQDVRRYARGALAAAGAVDLAPVPVDDVVAAVGLHKESLFDLGEPDLPPRIRALAKKFTGRVLGAMAIKEKILYVDESLSPTRRRFTQAHEIGHHALPWHEGAYFVDDRTNLSPDTRRLLEREANAFAAEVLFGLNRFTDEADAYRPGLGGPLAIAGRYGASSHAALRRYAETSGHPVALVAFGRYTTHGGRAFKVFPTQCATSGSFAERYGNVTTLFSDHVLTASSPALMALATLSDRVHEDTLEMSLDTRIGTVTFRAGLFYNQYLRFMLLTRRTVLGRRVRAVNQRTTA